MKEKTEYRMMDIAKMFCAFLVVGIHAEPFQNFWWLDQGFAVLTRIAVPFFFVASSYFYFLKETTIKGTLRFCARNAVIYLAWTHLYYLLEIIRTGNQKINYLPQLVDILLKGKYHLWFLQALVISVFLFSILDILVSNKLILYLLAACLLVLGILASTYYKIFSGVPFIFAFKESRIIQYIGTRNGIFYAPMYIMMGYRFARSGRKLSGKNAVIGSLVCFLVLALEGYIMVTQVGTNETILWWSVIPLIYCIFSFVLAVEVPGDSKKYQFIRKCSTVIFLVHPALITCFDIFIGNRILLYLLVFSASFFVAAILCRISECKNMSWLKRLI